MKLTLLALAPFALASPLVKRQQPTAQTPSSSPTSLCALSCIAHAETAQLSCAPYDINCFCTNSTITDYLDLCFTAACSEDEREAADSYLETFCQAANETSSVTTRASSSTIVRQTSTKSLALGSPSRAAVTATGVVTANSPQGSGGATTSSAVISGASAAAVAATTAVGA